MSLNIIIGVGGTGAKVVEATLHLISTGLGPNSLSVGFVDQDDGNGNLVRARGVLSAMQNARAAWRAGGDHGIEGDDIRLLRPEVRPLATGGHELWTPEATPHARLSTIFGGMDPDDRLLFDCLFAQGELEQDMLLDKGFRGRPAIGSAVMAALAPQTITDAAEPFWASLMQQLGQAQQGQQVRLLLTGSVFGGTGAAGFPTLARLLRRRLKDQGIASNVSISGILMAPYFTFSPPPTQEGLSGNVARAEHLLIQSRGAMNYYHHMFPEEHIFDDVMIFGWNHPFQLGYHKDGAGEQLNPALAPELFAGLCACDYFLGQHPAGVGGRQNRVRVMARENDNRLTWTDLPSPVAEADAPYRAIGRLLRFSAAWRYFAPLFRGGANVRKQHGGAEWFRRLDLHKVDFDDTPPDAEIAAMNALLDRFAGWCGEMQAYGNRGDSRFELWRVNRLLSGPPDFSRPWALLSPRAELAGNEWANALDEVVIPIPGRTLPTANDLFRRLAAARTATGAHSGLGRLTASLFDLAGVAQ